MVYIHFPSNLTEEELMLQAKYAKLKKKKKALQALKAPKQEPEKNLIPKRPADARDAREVARKLLKSGAIQAIQKPQLKQESSFKRPKGQERKRSQQESSPGAQYQSFSSVETPPPNPTTSPDPPLIPAAVVTAPVTATAPPVTPVPDKEPNRIPNLYQQFANERDKEEQAAAKAGDSPRDRPRSGNTVYVSGNKVTEDFLKKHFHDFGEILNISMEIEKGRGFITFSKTESADRAIGELHSKTVGGIQLQVQLARRQPQINPINDAATNRSQKGKHKDNRELVCYDHDDIF
ncbi:negative elongation factor E isoform X2 [Topomyia yanbarensis]|uniref:negative elongation factor E isoform X2 n=1 Tax=Topomyia yanbarensis TaxID=2498891 RepID=UPI00273B01D7|nr:negative elongation factor E isoform X2 [Topomyia yanbarensis]XP_058838885.1 negative elongation factor E isoform X2 [Topomyia yanbarensis]